MAYNAWFQCINGCPGQFDLREVIYRCPTCGDLLEVQHDMDALRSRSAAAWMQLFKDRTHGNVYPYGSGVWSKKEWVVPFINNENIVSMYEGNSNLLWADRYGKQLHVEDLVDQAVRQLAHRIVQGSRHDGPRVDREADDGEWRADRRRGVRVDRVTRRRPSAPIARRRAFQPSCCCRKDKVSIAQLVQPLANGALVLSLDTDFDGCMAVVQEITKEKRHLSGQLDEQSCASRARRPSPSRSCSSSTGKCRTGS